MNFPIVLALTKLFDLHRIVFWCDAKRELREDLEVLSLPNIKMLDPRPGCQRGLSHAGTLRHPAARPDDH